MRRPSGSFLLISLAWAGCQKPAEPPPTALQVVPVSYPVKRSVTEVVEFTGRTDAVQSVGIRARVTGFLTEVNFKEGTEVKKDEVLFEIDPRPYRAQRDQAVSQVGVAKAQHKLAMATLARAKQLLEKNAISQQEVDQDQAAVDQAAAQIEAAKANLKVFQLNLDFTEVRTPIAGKVSRYFYTIGNLIIQDQTLLTTVVSVDPIYAYFDMDERTVLRIRKAINKGLIKPRLHVDDLPVEMGLDGEEGYPHAGSIDFVNNVVNPSTGTVAVRGKFENPEPENGRRLITPGMFVRIRLPIGEPRPSLLVVDRALGSDQGLKFVYVIDAENKVQYRRVTPGPLQDDGLRVIEEGLKGDDRVVVGALPQLRPRMLVDPELSAMPTPGPPLPPTAAPVRSNKP
jgi:multidrug efflux system membrane fusion protein